MSAAVTEPGGRTAPSEPLVGPRPQRRGPSPFVVLAGGFALGIALAKWIDWRGHAHPRR